MYKELISQFTQKPPRERAAFIGIVAAVFVVLSVFIAAAVTIPDKFDRDGCPANGALASDIFIIDRTGEIPASAKRAIMTNIESLIEKAPVGTRFSLFEIDSQYMRGLSSTIFSGCKGRDGSHANALNENPEMIRKKYEKDFLNPLLKALEGCLTGSGQPRSPIMEALVDITSVTEFQTDVPVTIHIFSDMLQHTDAYSQYSGVQDFQTAQKEPEVQKLFPNLHGANIEIYYLLRSGKELALQGNTHVQFWLDLMTEADGQLTLVKKIR